MLKRPRLSCLFYIVSTKVAAVRIPPCESVAAASQ